MNAACRRWGWVVALAALGLGFARLRFDVDVLSLLPDDLPTVQGLRLYEQHFSNARELIVTVRSASSKTTELAARALAHRLRRATNLVDKVVWQPPWLEHPEQLTELIAHLWLNQPPRVFSDLAERLAPTNLPRVIAATRDELATTMSPADLARLSYDPFGLTRLPDSVVASAPSWGEEQSMFASPDGTFRLVFVRARSDLPGYRDCALWVEQVRGVVESGTAAGNPTSNTVTFSYTGRPAFVAEISAAMKRDMTGSVAFTAVIIAVLFWLAHRRWAPMLWLLALLALILAGTLALGGLLFGTLDVVSLGFAAILLGLAVDYGVVHYQEALASPDAVIPEIRRAIGPSIFWAATTTISAFLALNLGGLPGLAQLGSLVALGVGLSAIVMLFAFLPPLFRDRMRQRREQIAAGTWPPPVAGSRPLVPGPVPGFRARRVFLATSVLVLSSVAVLSRGWPRLDHSADVLRPRNSPAEAALEEIKSRLAQGREPLWLILRGRTEDQVGRQLDEAASLLDRAVSNRWIQNYALPTALWSRTEFQVANRATAARMAGRRELMRAAALAGGFATNALALTDTVLDRWQAAAASDPERWPTNDLSRWILDKMVARSANSWVVVGYVFLPAADTVALPQLARWVDELSNQGFLLSGWELVGESVLTRVQKNLWRVILPMAGLVLLSLGLAFRRPEEMFLSLAVLTLSGLCLLAVMRIAGWSWNLLNLMALPLMLGTGVDYSIFMQLALRRHAGDLAAAHRSVGRALLLCGGTAVAGFGSLAGSSNGGMAGLGEICAVGIGWNMLISVFLLPVWWTAWNRPKPDTVRAPLGRVAPSAKPSSLYRTETWLLGLLIGRILPAKLCEWLTRRIATLYYRAQPRRREAVIHNLLPVVNQDREAAERAARALFQQFALKLADLWRYESGGSVDRRPTDWSGWEILTSARARARGVLLVTPHLGNWEFGGAFLARRGFDLLVLTQAEPGRALTALRQTFRARSGIETLVIGEDAFAFLEIIKRLQAGATVALLVDRPPPSTAVSGELFGQPFLASIAAAELARASGCAVVPVYVVRKSGGYAAHVLPEIVYHRASLRERAARLEMTQEILRAFEPVIRQYLTQWYHFVPIWPHDTQGEK